CRATRPAVFYLSARNPSQALERRHTMILVPWRPLPLFGAGLILTATPATAFPQATSAPIATSIAARTAGMERRDGFLPIYLDGRQGHILLELPHDSARALLMLSQATGLGSNPIGIDRGASGETHVARFDRDGDRVLVVLENWGYRSTSGDAEHGRTVAEAFPPSTVAALPLLADEGGRLLVEATDLALRD